MTKVEAPGEPFDYLNATDEEIQEQLEKEDAWGQTLAQRGEKLPLPTISDPDLAAKLKEKFGWDFRVEELRPDLYVSEEEALSRLDNPPDSSS